MLTNEQCELIKKRLLSLRDDINRNYREGFGGFLLIIPLDDPSMIELIENNLINVCIQIREILENSLDLDVQGVGPLDGLPRILSVSWPKHHRRSLLPAAE